MEHFAPSAPMRRLRYILISISLLAVAFALLRIVLVMLAGEMVFINDAWHFLDPLGLVFANGREFWYAVAIHLALSVGLTAVAIHRATDAGINPWLGLLMLIPVVRVFVFTAFAVLPSEKHTSALDIPKATMLGRILPRSTMGSAITAVLLAMFVALPLGFLNVRIMNEYGLVLFIGLPFLIGVSSSYCYNYHQVRSIQQSIGVGLMAILLALALIFLLAMEGLLCLIMAAPLAALIAIPGAMIGHALSGNIHRRGPTITSMLLLAPAFMAFEANQERISPEFKVTTSVIVEATPKLVWDRLVAFSPMAPPTELLFLSGISYPMQARIEGTGIGAVRYCQFNTGPFVEPITVWNEPVLLAFDVAKAPPPMTEMTIYDNINAPHVEGFFHSKHGQFRLTPNPDGTTTLEGTTWYTHDIWPAWYWRVWSDAILHRIHGRVLEHIKADAEL